MGTSSQLKPDHSPHVGFALFSATASHQTESEAEYLELLVGKQTSLRMMRGNKENVNLHTAIESEKIRFRKSGTANVCF